MNDRVAPPGSVGPRPRPAWVARSQKLTLKLLDLPSVYKRRSFNAVRREFYAALWDGAADDVGAEVMRHPGGMTEIRRGDLATFVNRSDLMLDTSITTQLMADKALTYALFAKMGLSVPDHTVFTLGDPGPAEALLQRHPGGIVIKPATGTGGGRGVTTGILTRKQLAQAARYATGFNPRLLAEPHMSGANYRLLYLDGRLIDVVRRDPPVVLGDGASTIAALVQAENTRRAKQRPITALSPLIIDSDCRNHLAAQGLGPSAKPAKGRTVTVKTAINENAAPQNHSVLADIHPDLATAGQRLVTRFGVRFAGVDLMADDITAPPERGGAQFGEINVNPGIHHHYLVADPDRAVPVAALLLEHIFNERQGVIEL